MSETNKICPIWGGKKTKGKTSAQLAAASSSRGGLEMNNSAKGICRGRPAPQTVLNNPESCRPHDCDSLWIGKTLVPISRNIP